VFKIKLQRLPDQFECKLKALDCGITHYIGRRKGGHFIQASGRIQNRSLTFGKTFFAHKLLFVSTRFSPLRSVSNQFFEQIAVTFGNDHSWHSRR